MSEKKVVGRSVLIALEIVCIILLACLVGATSLYQSQINDKDNTITNLQNQVNDVNNILDLAKSTVWVNNQTISQETASSYTVWYLYASYAGYVSFYVQSSSVAGTHVEVTYSSHGVYFSQEMVFSVGGNSSLPNPTLNCCSRSRQRQRYITRRSN